MSFRDYQAAAGLSHSMMRELHPTPFHLQIYLKHPPEQTPAQLIGTLTHSVILEPDKPLPRLAIQPGEYINEGEIKKWNNNAKVCREWHLKQSFEGLIAVTQTEYDKVLGMAESVANFSVTRELFAEGDSEVSVFAPMIVAPPDIFTAGKARLDWVTPGNTLADIKTCEDASPEAFIWTVIKNRYHSQAAWYLDIWNANPYHERKECFVLVAVEKSPPHLVATYQLEEELIEEGRELNRKDALTYAACVESGNWPAYPEEYVKLKRPEKSR